MLATKKNEILPVCFANVVTGQRIDKKEVAKTHERLPMMAGCSVGLATVWGHFWNHQALVSCGSGELGFPELTRQITPEIWVNSSDFVRKSVQNVSGFTQMHRGIEIFPVLQQSCGPSITKIEIWM